MTSTNSLGSIESAIKGNVNEKPSSDTGELHTDVLDQLKKPPSFLSRHSRIDIWMFNEQYGMLCSCKARTVVILDTNSLSFTQFDAVLAH